MHFNVPQTYRIWKSFLDWPVVTNVQFNYAYMERKGTIEIWLFFETLDGEQLRSDFELDLGPDVFSTPYLYNWTNDDIDHMVSIIQQITESTMHDWQKVHD